MAAPQVSFSVTGGNAVSAVDGFDRVVVAFSADRAYTAFECRATKAGEEWGRGTGVLVAAFSATPAGVVRSFEVYDRFLTDGDGVYRLGLYARGEDGSWNDNTAFLPRGAGGLFTGDGKSFLCMK